MKRYISTLLFLLFAALSHAQHNVVKANLSSAALLNAYVSYERTFGRHFSVNLGINMFPDRNIPFSSNFEDVNKNVSPIKTMKMEGWGITPEFRFYTSSENGSPKGFYVAPYFRYSQILFQKSDYKYNYLDIYNDNKSKTSSIDFNGQNTSIGGGVMIGNQWIIGKHFSIDFWIVGLGMSNSSFTMNASSNDMDSRYFEKGSSFEKDVESYLKVFNSINIQPGNNFLKASSEQTLPSLRGLGLNVGFAF